MLLKIFIILIIIIAIIAFIASLRPNEFRVTRTALIAAPPPAVFPYVNDLHRWQEWSPWAKMDPNAQNTFVGPTDGTGAVFSWIGNSKVGEGRMTITESRQDQLVRFKLEFFKPFKGTNTAEFIFKPQGNQTQLTWSMFGEANFVSKLMGLFMDCDKMVGGQFEDGFRNLKSIVEKQR